jgi:hypothetical protein
MSVSNDLFLAILSLDAYNRGYNSGVNMNGTAIGNAQLSTGSGITGQDVGFYAQAYNWDGTKVISYRGTDDPRKLGTQKLEKLGTATNSFEFYLRQR